MMDLSAIVMTGNESLHIERCIEKLRPWCREIFVVDSCSTDNTVDLARAMGAKVVENPWPGYAEQFNWALDNLEIKTAWTIRVDADEYLSDELVEELETTLPGLPDDVTGVVLTRMQDCMGKWVHRVKMLRVFRTGTGRCEQRLMDEHIVLSRGRSVGAKNLFYDHNLNSLGWWIDKHNDYATREAVQLLDMKYGLIPKQEDGTQMAKQSQTKRNTAKRYAKAPLFWRSAAYFFLRYILMGGFLKGTRQFIWDFFQGWWFRALVDAKIYEIERACGGDRQKMIAFIRDVYKKEYWK